ncbi:MAG: hypothetical protein HY023_10325 [Chloroflexi bacterium]|nr:hypothetical protein [Chloroflexota bacterium]
MIPAAGGTMAEPQRSALNALADRWAIPIGGGILGAAMIAFGVWWWRRGATPPAEPEAESDPESEWPNVLRAIADLDAARERGEVAEEAYRSRRAELRAKARAILQAREGAK